MNEKIISLLEFEKIRDAVAARALSEESARLVLDSAPLDDPAKAAELKTSVRELSELMARRPGEPRAVFPSIGFLFPRLEVEGARLELDEAYAIALFAERAGELRAWLSADAGGSSADASAATLKDADADWARAVREWPDASPVAREVFRVLTREGALRDLPVFREIKQRIRRFKRDVETLLVSYTNTEDYRRMLQSGVPAQRDGRAVLAVKANFRGRIRGIVHEVSSTGQTIFVEPEDIVEKNNDILIEEKRLEAEIRRVLLELTDKIRGEGDKLKRLHGEVIRFETIRARARYGLENNFHFAVESGPQCGLPQNTVTQDAQPENVSRDGLPQGGQPENAQAGISLKKASHPLLFPAAVPIDFALNEAAVIITGPNTGGKTVTLKTVGLLALMNQFGLALPVEDGSVLPFFDGVYGDIGDEQSISQSLSTFSAHMTNIAYITGHAAENSLVLLDELGAGTDPEEGSAIAMAILDHLIEKGCRVLATTHHGILKNYGYTRKGVLNASVEFDGKTLSPTYRVVMGIPGESRALEIAGRSGLPGNIVDSARSYLDEERADISALILTLKNKHRELDDRLRAGEEEERRLREDRRFADIRELKLRQKELDLKDGSLGSIRSFLSESRKTLENLVREVREGELSREKNLKVKQFLSDLEKETLRINAEFETERDALEAEARKVLEGERDEAGEGLPINGVPANNEDIDGFMPGQSVLAGKEKRRGIIAKRSKKGVWLVQVGSLKMNFTEAELVKVKPEKQGAAMISSDLAETTQAKFELNLRGMRLEEALRSLQAQIDAAVLTGLCGFSVVHGKGDGILQNGVHEFLRQNREVAEYHFSRPELGGFGRTEVTLKR